MAEMLMEVPLATARQVQFLNHLLGEKNLAGTRYEGHNVAPAGLTVRDAAEAIAELVGTPAKVHKEAVPGYYSHGDKVYEVVKSKQGHTYAKQMIVNGPWAKWEFVPGAMATFQQWEPMTLEDAAQWGKKFGSCMICGRLLVKPESIERGIGPICAEKF